MTDEIVLVSKNKKWSAVTGVRYRNNSLLVNSQDTQTNYTPTFVDFQTNINYDISEKWQMSFLGNISQNKYLYQPSELLEHFVTVVIPLEQMKTIPTQPQIKLPKHPDDITSGPNFAGLIDLNHILHKNAQT